MENRYQDSGWEPLDGEDFLNANAAARRAAGLSKDAICYGMVRVVDMAVKKVVVTYAAGGGKVEG